MIFVSYFIGSKNIRKPILEYDMLTAGLTGGIATGKSMVGSLFQKQGARVVEFDNLSRAVVEPPSQVLDDIARAFGGQVLNKDGSLKRRVLRDIIFNDAKSRLLLNQIIHPAMKDLLHVRLAEIEADAPRSIVLIDTPLLYELQWQDEIKPVILVYAPPQMQMQRLMQRDGVDMAAAQAALSSQLPIDKKVDLSQFVIDNSGSLEQTLAQVQSTWSQLQKLSAQKS